MDRTDCSNTGRLCYINPVLEILTHYEILIMPGCSLPPCWPAHRAHPHPCMVLTLPWAANSRRGLIGIIVLRRSYRVDAGISGSTHRTPFCPESEHHRPGQQNLLQLAGQVSEKA